MDLIEDANWAAKPSSLGETFGFSTSMILPNSIQLSGSELLASSGTWIVCECPDSLEDAPYIFLGDRAQIFGDRLLELQAISCHAP